MHYSADPASRVEFICALEDLAKFLAHNPAVPVPLYGEQIRLHASSFEDGGQAQVDHLARLLGATITDDTPHGGHYIATRQFGCIAYMAVAIPAACTAVYDAETTSTAQPRSSVNHSLTPKRRRRITENDEYAAFLTRAIRAYSRRVASGDIEAISDMTRLAADLDSAIGEAITGLRGIGYSWADIGLRLGITRQAAQQRWGSDTTHDTGSAGSCA